MIQKIIFPDNTPLQELKAIFNTLLNYGECRIVGGCIRDILSKNCSQDFDIATTVAPVIALEILLKAGIKTIPTGIKHGTITSFINGKHFEITTLRTDKFCDGRHAVVEFTNNWKEDAMRRDFTINTLYADLDGNLYDYFSGINDLNIKLLRFVGDPVVRIKEDHLRILRYFRFHSYMGGDNIHSPSLNAVIDNAALISTLSGERIQKELYKMLCSPFAVESLNLIFRYDILKSIGLSNKTLNLNKFTLSHDAKLNLALIIKLLNISSLQFQELASRLKLSNSDKAFLKKICYMMENSQHSLNGLLYYYGRQLTNSYLSLHNMLLPSKINMNLLRIVENYQPIKLPITGNDLLQAGFAGKEISVMIKLLEDSWIASDFKLNRDDLLNELKRHIL